MSPWNRHIVDLSLYAVPNHIHQFRRLPYIPHQDLLPIDAQTGD